MIVRLARSSNSGSQVTHSRSTKLEIEKCLTFVDTFRVCVAGASISTSGITNVTSSTPGFVTISAKDAVSIGTSNVGATFFAASVSDISSTGVLSAGNSAFYSAKGNIGPVNTVTTGTIKANAAGSVDVSNTGNTTFVASTAGANMKLASTGTLTETGGINVSGALQLSASAFNTTAGTTVTAGSIAINGLAGNDLLIANIGAIKASTGNITIDAPVDQDLIIGVLGENGNIQAGPAGTINLSVSTSASASNIIDFIGNETFTGNTFLNATGVNQAVTVEGGFTVIGNNALTVNSQKINLLGTLQGNPLIFSAKGAGTIANSNAAAALDLKNLGNLTFTGQSLTLLSAGNIVNTGKSLSINLSGVTNPVPNSGTGAGGSLELIAGFNFTNGPIAPALPPATGSFQLTTSNAGKNITLTNVSINTSASSLYAAGGNVRAVATGAIKLGTINTSANNLTASGGSVTVIGNGVTTGAINASALTAGNVSITSAIPSITGTITVTNGIAYGGSFTAGTPGGNVRVNGINAGNISLTTGGTGTITQSGGSISTNALLSLSNGTKGFTLKTAAANLQMNTNGNATITSSVLTSLNTSNIGGNLQVTGTNGISVGNSQAISSAGNLKLTNNSKTAGITVGAGASLSAGSLSGGPASPAPLVSTNIQKAGSIALTSAGTGTAINIADNATLTSNGAGITLKSSSAGSSIIGGNGLLLQANGGSIMLTSAGQSKFGNIGGTVSNMVARSLNGGQGTISVKGTTGVVLGDAANLVANKAITLTSSGSTSTMTFGDDVVLKSGLQSTGALTVKGMGSGGLTIGTGADFESNAGAMTLSSVGSMNIGDDSTISVIGKGNIILSQSNAAGTLSIGDNYKLSTSNGSIAISGKKGLNLGTVGGSALSVLTANGASAGSVKLSAAGTSGLVLGAGTLNSATTFTVASTAGPTQLSGTVIGTVISKPKTVTISSTTGTTIDNAAQISSFANLTITSTLATGNLSFGDGVQLNAGTLVGTPPANGVLNPSQIATKGSILLTAGAGASVGNSNIWTSNGGDIKLTAKTAAITFGTSNQFIANGGNEVMLAKGTVSGANGNFFHARAVGTTAANGKGGGIEIGSGLISSTKLNAAFSKAPGTIPTNINALGIGVSFAGNINGVIQANTSGTGFINLNAGPNPASVLTLNGTPPPVGSAGGAQVFDAMGNGSSVIFDNATFQTEALKPIGMVSSVEVAEDDTTNLPVLVRSTGAGKHAVLIGNCNSELRLLRGDDGSVEVVPFGPPVVEPKKGKLIAQVFARSKTKFVQHDNVLGLQSGEFFLNSCSDMTVRTRSAQVKLRKGGLASISTEPGCTYVRSCSASGSVTVLMSGKTIALNPGEELAITNNKPSTALAHLSDDGLARRNSRSFEIGQNHVTISEFAIISLLWSSESLAGLNRSNVGSDKQLLARMLKNAATVDIVLKHRGAYTAR